MHARASYAGMLVIVIALVLAMSSGLSVAASGIAPDKALYDEAMKHYYTGDYEESARLLKKYIKDSADPKAYFRLGYSLYKLGRHDEANKYFEQSYLVTPDYTPTPELEKKHKQLKNVRPEGYYEGNIKEAPAETPEGLVADEEASTLAVPEQEDAVEEAMEPEGLEEEAPPAEDVAEAPVETAAPAPAPKAKPAPRQPTPPQIEITEYQAIYAALAVFLLLFMIPVLAFVLVFYVAHAFFLYRVAGKTNVGTPLLAFIPLVNAITLSQAAGKSIVFGIAIILFSIIPFAGPFVVPLVGQDSIVGLILTIASGILPLVAWILRAVLWMFVADNLGKKKIIGLLTIIPGIHLIIIGWFAFSKGGGSALPPIHSTDAQDLSGEPDLDLPDVPDDFDDLDMGSPDDLDDLDIGSPEDMGDMDDIDFSESDLDDNDFK